MSADKQVTNDKVTSLNQTLASVENELMARALDRRDAELDHATDIINHAIDAGAIEMDCDGEAKPEGEAEQETDGE